jgi:hypothetical protein
MTANQDLEQRIINWSMWAKSGKNPPTSCRSLESRYKSPQCWHAEQARMPIDILDAVEVEKAIIKLPRQQLNIIVYAYIRSGYDFHAFCSKNRIHGTKLVSKAEQFKIDQLRAETMLKNILYKGLDYFDTMLYKGVKKTNPELIAAV